jgi:hypothetical protein
MSVSEPSALRTHDPCDLLDLRGSNGGWIAYIEILRMYQTRSGIIYLCVNCFEEMRRNPGVFWSCGKVASAFAWLCSTAAACGGSATRFAHRQSGLILDPN